MVTVGRTKPARAGVAAQQEVERHTSEIGSIRRTSTAGTSR